MFNSNVFDTITHILTFKLNTSNRSGFLAHPVLYYVYLVVKTNMRQRVTETVTLLNILSCYYTAVLARPKIDLITSLK